MKNDINRGNFFFKLPNNSIWEFIWPFGGLVHSLSRGHGPRGEKSGPMYGSAPGATVKPWNVDRGSLPQGTLAVWLARSQNRNQTRNTEVPCANQYYYVFTSVSIFDKRTLALQMVHATHLRRSFLQALASSLRGTENL